MKEKCINISIVILGIAAIIINQFFDSYKAIGAGCIILMGMLAIRKGMK